MKTCMGTGSSNHS